MHLFLLALRHRSAQTGLKSLKKNKTKKISKNNQLKNSNPRQAQQQNSKQTQKQPTTQKNSRNNRKTTKTTHISKQNQQQAKEYCMQFTSKSTTIYILIYLFQASFKQNTNDYFLEDTPVCIYIYCIFLAVVAASQLLVQVVYGRRRLNPWTFGCCLTGPGPSH